MPTTTAILRLSRNRPYVPCLVGLASASLILRVPRRDVLLSVDDGRLSWVWDLSITQRRRELRFWLPELHGEQRYTPIDMVIGQVVGHHGHRSIRAVEVAEALGVAVHHTVRLAEAKLLTINRIEWNHVEVDRESLVSLLRARLIGAEVPLPPTPAPPERPITHTVTPAPVTTYAQR